MREVPAPRRPTKHSVKVGDLKTSVTIEDAFWRALREIAIERCMSMPNLVTSINADRRQSNLSSAIRVFVLRHYVTEYKRRI
jgi:predicted DNA-binding ribbon-helix-helix protein